MYLHKRYLYIHKLSVLFLICFNFVTGIPVVEYPKAGKAALPVFS